MTKPRLILTGGTICSEESKETGLLVPNSANLDGCIAKTFGDPKVTRLFNIDSINFDIDEHYEPLLKETVAALKAGETPIICGGTDSMSWYSTLLSEDLKRRGFLKPDSGEKVLFLSSMKSFDKAPQLVQRIFDAAKILMDQPVTGGLVMSARTEDGRIIDVHDATNGLDKISSSLINAFRSNAPVGYIVDDHFNPDGGYVDRNAALYLPRMAPEAANTLARVAPPLIGGTDENAVSYLRLAGQEGLFDAVIIEGLPARDPNPVQMNYHPELIRTVKDLTAAGTRVIFVNPVHYDDKRVCMRPMIDEKTWKPDEGAMSLLKNAGAEFMTGVPKDIYIQAMLNSPIRQHSPLPKTALPLRKQEFLGMRYVPDSNIMQTALHGLNVREKPMVGHVGLSALPNASMMDKLADMLDERVEFTPSFTYNGRIFVDDDGKVVHEGREEGSNYAAGQATRRRLAGTGSGTPDFR